MATCAILTALAACGGARDFEVFPVAVGDSTLSSPNCIAYHPSGFWVVSDTGNDRVVTMALDLTIRSVLQDTLCRPRGVAVDSLGRIWICDSGNNRVLVADESLNIVRTLGEEGSGPGQFDLPWGVSAGLGGRVAVSDSLNRRIQVFDLNGSLLVVFGSQGTGPGEFDGPLDVSFDSGGRILVVDSYLQAEGYVRRVQVFNSDCTFNRTIWDIESRLRFTRPVGIGVDPLGNFAVADFMAGRIYIFSSNGTHLGGITGVGGQPGLVTPFDVAFAQPPGEGVLMAIVERDPGRVRTLRISISERLLWSVLSLAVAIASRMARGRR